MHKERLLNLANIIEAGCLIEQDIGFNMGDYIADGEIVKDQSGHHCGTVACIAGHAAIQKALEEGKRPPDISAYAQEIHEAAQDYLELSDTQASNLFIPNTDAYYEDITPEQAVKVIRNLAETGRTNWKEVL